MSLWQLSACIRGWNRAQGAEEPVEAPTAAEFETLMATVH